MASHRVIHYIAGSKTILPTVHLHCHIKPRASKVREGVTALTADAVHICVAAIPKDGESNKAVLAVLSQVRSFVWCVCVNNSASNWIHVGAQRAQV